MSNEIVNQDVKMDSASSGDTANSVKQDEKMNMIPQARFDQAIAKEREKNAELMKQVDAYNAKKEKDRQKQLEKEGNYKQILEEKDTHISSQNKELENLRNFKAEYEAKEAEKREKLMEQLPEEQRGIYSGLNNEQLEAHLNMNNNNINKVPTATNQNARKGNEQFGGYSSIEEWAMKDPVACDNYLQKEVNGYQWNKR